MDEPWNYILSALDNLEDSYLLTESGLKRLSAAVPRTLEEVEATLRSGASR